MLMISARSLQGRLRFIGGKSGFLLESYLPRFQCSTCTLRRSVYHGANNVDPYEMYRSWNTKLEALLLKETQEARVTIDNLMKNCGNGETVHSIEKKIQERSLATGEL